MRIFFNRVSMSMWWTGGQLRQSVGSALVNVAQSALKTQRRHFSSRQRERTLSIVKPDAVEKQKIGEIISRQEEAGLSPVSMKMMHLTRVQAGQFYSMHRERPFFQELVDYMTSGPVVVQVLEGEDAIERNRELMGHTDPKKAEPGTIRADFAESVEANAVHGSDSPESAEREIAFFFGKERD